MQSIDAGIVVRLGLGIALICLAFSPPATYCIDGNSMLDVSVSLITQHSFTVPPSSHGKVWHAGSYYGSWYPLLSIVAIPFVAIGLAAANVLGLPPRYVAGASGVILSSLLIAATSAVLALLVVRMGGNRRTAILGGLAFAFGTMALAFTHEFYAEPLVSLITVSAFYYALGRSSHETNFVALLSGLAVLAKPTAVVVGLSVAAYYIVEKRSKTTVAKPLLGTVAGIALYLAYNYVRFGVATKFGYDRPPMALHFIPQALLGYLVSPGKSLALFCPPVVAAVALSRPWGQKATRRQAGLLIGGTAGFVLIHAAFADWHGLWCWGPRYLLPAVPLLIALVAFADHRARKWLAISAILGLLINAPTLLAYTDRYISDLRNARQISIRRIVWSPAYSQVLHQWPAVYDTFRDASGVDPRILLRSAGGAAPKSGNKEEILSIVPTWWWMLPCAGIPWQVGGCLAALMVGTGVFLIRRSVIGTRSEADNDGPLRP